jgi:hypothetical protein
MREGDLSVGHPGGVGRPAPSASVGHPGGVGRPAPSASVGHPGGVGSRYRYRFCRGIGIWSVYTRTISQYRRPAPSASAGHPGRVGRASGRGRETRAQRVGRASGARRPGIRGASVGHPGGVGRPAPNAGWSPRFPRGDAYSPQSDSLGCLRNARFGGKIEGPQHQNQNWRVGLMRFQAPGCRSNGCASTCQMPSYCRNGTKHALRKVEAIHPL